MAHTPFSVAATSTAPNEHCPTANRITAPAPPQAVCGGRHAQPRGGLFVEAAGCAVSCVVDRLRDRAAAAKAGSGAPGQVRVGVALGRDASGGLEHAVQVVRAEAGGGSDGGEGGRLLRVLDQAAGALDGGGVAGGDALSIRLAAEAGAETGGLGSSRGRVEPDILAPGRAGGAVGAAVNAGGADREHEGAVQGRVAAADSVVAGVVGEGRWSGP